MRILGIDPGGTTGIVLAEWSGSGREFAVVESAAFTWEERFHLYTYVERTKWDVVVMESFHLYGHLAKNMVGSDFPSSQIIGAIEATIHRSRGSLDDVHYQPAYVMKSVQVVPVHAEIVGLMEHRKDAYKHVRYWILRNAHGQYAKPKKKGNVLFKTISDLLR